MLLFVSLTRCVTMRVLPRLMVPLTCALGLFVATAWADEGAPIVQHDRWVTSVAFSPDGAMLVTGGGQSLQYRPGEIQLWDIPGGKPIAALEGHEANVWSMALSPDAKTLVSSSYDGKVIVWDLTERKPRATLDKYKNWVRSVAFAPSGQHFAAAAEDGNVTIWAVEGLQEVKTIKAHESAVYAVAFSPDSQTLATAGTDKTAKLWDWNAGTEKAKLEGHDDAVWCVAFSLDGTRIATAGADRKIILRDANGAPQATLHGHTDWVSKLAFSPDSKTLASSSLDRSVKLWNLEAAVQLAGPVAEAVQRVADVRKAIDDAGQQAADAQTQSDAAKKKADVVAAIIKSKETAEKLKQAQAAVDGDANNQDLVKARDEAKTAAEAAAKEVEDKVKLFADNKEFTDQLNKLKEGAVDAAVAEKATHDKAVEEAAAKVKEADDKKAAAEAGLAAALAQRQQLYDQQSTTLTGYQSTVWTVAFSPDGSLLATGTQRVGTESGTNTIRVWKLADRSELFPAPPPAEPKKEE